MMRGKLRPKILSISSAPNAKTYVTYYAKMVYFLKHFLVKVAYSYRESPLTWYPTHIPSTNLLSLPFLIMYIEEANEPSWQILVPF